MHPDDTSFWQSTFNVEVRSREPRAFLGAPAELIAWNWELAEHHLRESGKRVHRELLEAARDPSPSWLTENMVGDGLPPEWFHPLLAEDPEYAQIEQRLALVQGNPVEANA